MMDPYEKPRRRPSKGGEFLFSLLLLIAILATGLAAAVSFQQMRSDYRPWYARPTSADTLHK